MKNIVCWGILVLFLLAVAAQAVQKYDLSGRSSLIPAEVRAWNFVRYRMTDPDGRIFRMVAPGQRAENSVLESQGQAMEYLALIGDRELFSWYAKATDHFYRDAGGYYFWEVRFPEGQGNKVTALIDDVRIFRAYDAAQRKGMGEYGERLRALADEIYRLEVDEGGNPVSYYSAETGQRDTGVNPFYLDVATFDRMAEYDERWKKPAENARRILREMPEHPFGFYPARFEIEGGAYSKDESFNMVESLYTAFFARDAGRNVKPFVGFLKRESEKGVLYNIYRPDGTPLEKHESTAVYALAARFMQAAGERKAAAVFRGRMMTSQIAMSRDFAGGFSMDASETVYAFDQLEALLTLRTMPVD